MLRFDREYTQRTKIYDDQADYFSNSVSNWLTEDEKMESKLKDDERRSDMHERKKMVMKLNIG